LNFFQKLNGWQRIGIVLSFIWMLTTGPINYWEKSGEELDIRDTRNSICESYKKTKENRKECIETSEYLAKERIKQIQDQSLFISFGFIPFFWLITYIMVLIGKWIRNGFKK
jgi:hypothetical protein